ncbi:hypothetical protein ATK36_0657 [Amycolatopsis sulphurea]|uniref:Uncharacterized protein n=1 Tax=Amycolatopsis sulphurea TaxID=76022 RepID=A0A2A9G368_9PSEU|nr:hypothetical protein ATK36_0657 [Amycolatopsis sulphurea]
MKGPFTDSESVKGPFTDLHTDFADTLALDGHGARADFVDEGERGRSLDDDRLAGAKGPRADGRPAGSSLRR